MVATGQISALGIEKKTTNTICNMPWVYEMTSLTSVMPTHRQDTEHSSACAGIRECTLLSTSLTKPPAELLEQIQSSKLNKYNIIYQTGSTQPCNHCTHACQERATL